MHILTICISFYKLWFISCAHFSIKILVHHPFGWMAYIKSSSHVLQNNLSEVSGCLHCSPISSCVCSFLLLQPAHFFPSSRLVLWCTSCAKSPQWCHFSLNSKAVIILTSACLIWLIAFQYVYCLKRFVRQEPFLTLHRLSTLPLNNSDSNHWACWIYHNEKKKKSTGFKYLSIFSFWNTFSQSRRKSSKHKDNRNSLCV